MNESVVQMALRDSDADGGLLSQKVARAVGVCGGVAKLYNALGGPFVPIAQSPKTRTPLLRSVTMRNYPHSRHTIRGIK